MRSTPARVHWGIQRCALQYRTHHSLHAAMILCHHGVERVHLVHNDRCGLLRVTASDGGRWPWTGSPWVLGYLGVQCARSQSSSQSEPRRETEGPLVLDPERGLIHPPVESRCPLPSVKGLFELRAILQHPRTPRSCIISSLSRELKGYATYQRMHVRMTSCSTWAPLKHIIIPADFR
jgi:hypothetical protein